VIPTYNRANKLKQAIDSVLSQTFTDFEVLVMDDGSIDNTSELISSFNDSRIVYSWEKNYGGPSRPRNRGINSAKGEWICFLDSDDYWKVSKLKKCFDHLHGEVDLLYHDLVFSRDGLTEKKK
jgi:glycosyltransferase involved in cell wall biosynthesis